MKTKEEERAIKFEVLKEVAEANLKTFVHEFNKELFEYRALNTHRICDVLTEDEVRQLGVNFFTKMLMKKAYENENFYFDKKLTVRI